MTRRKPHGQGKLAPPAWRRLSLALSIALLAACAGDQSDGSPIVLAKGEDTPTTPPGATITYRVNLQPRVRPGEALLIDARTLRLSGGHLLTTLTSYTYLGIEGGAVRIQTVTATVSDGSLMPETRGPVLSYPLSWWRKRTLFEVQPQSMQKTVRVRLHQNSDNTLAATMEGP